MARQKRLWQEKNIVIGGLLFPCSANLISRRPRSNSNQKNNSYHIYCIYKSIEQLDSQDRIDDERATTVDRNFSWLKTYQETKIKDEPVRTDTSINKSQPNVDIDRAEK